MATKATAISGPFGSTMATRSSRPTPSSFSAETVRATWSRRLAYVSGRALGAAMATDDGLPAARSSEIVEGLDMDFLGVEERCAHKGLGRVSDTRMVCCRPM